MCIKSRRFQPIGDSFTQLWEICLFLLIFILFRQTVCLFNVLFSACHFTLNIKSMRFKNMKSSRPCSHDQILELPINSLFWISNVHALIIFFTHKYLSYETLIFFFETKKRFSSSLADRSGFIPDPTSQHRQDPDPT